MTDCKETVYVTKNWTEEEPRDLIYITKIKVYLAEQAILPNMPQGLKLVYY